MNQKVQRIDKQVSTFIENNAVDLAFTWKIHFVIYELATFTV